LAQVQALRNLRLLVPLFAACARATVLCSPPTMNLFSRPFRRLVKNTFITVEEAETSEPSETSPQNAPNIWSAPAGARQSDEDYQNEEFKKKNRHRCLPQGVTPISEEHDEKQIAEDHAKECRPETFGVDEGIRYNNKEYIKNTFIHVQAETECGAMHRSAPAPSVSGDWEKFEEEQYQNSLLRKTPHVAKTNEDDGRRDDSHHQDLTEMQRKIDALREQLQLLDEHVSRMDQLQNSEAADEKNKYKEHIISTQNGMTDMFPLFERELKWINHGHKMQEAVNRESPASDVGATPMSADARPGHADPTFFQQHSDRSLMSSATLPPGLQQQCQQQTQPPSQKPLVYRDALGGTHFCDSSTNSILAFIRVAKSKVNSRRRRKLMENVLFVRSEAPDHNEGALKMWVDVPQKTENLKCDQAMLHLDGNAFDELGGPTRYKVWMYAGDAMLSGDEWGSDLGDGWHEYGINEFGGNYKRPVCMLRDIKMAKLLAGNSLSIYLGVRLVPVH